MSPLVGDNPCLAAGMNGCLAKPFEPDELYAAVARRLQARQPLR